MRNFMNIVKTFCEKYDFANDATDYLSNAYDAIQKSKECSELFSRCVDAYIDNYDFDSEPIFAEIEKIGRTN